MWKSDSPAICSECGDTLVAGNWGGLCIVCDRVFCAQHVVVRNDVATCAACGDLRRRREEAGAISQADADRVLRLVGLDLVETVGPGHESVVQEAVARARMFSDDPDDFEQRVVDDVQQCLHDTYVDISWPACPELPNHPLGYSGDWWRCEQSGRRVAPVGGLRRGAG